MKVNLDKHDLFRDVAPGYVFLVVVFSFYTVTGKLGDISRVAEAIVVLVAGFPLGFVFHNIGRGIHLIFTEQKNMENKIAKQITKTLDEKIINRLSDDSKSLNRDLALLLTVFLKREENEEFEKRINFIISRFHSLSGSIIAIFSALFFILFVKYDIWNICYPWSRCGWTQEVIFTNVLCVIWLLIAIVFIISRCRAKKNWIVLNKQFIAIKKISFEKFINQ